MSSDRGAGRGSALGAGGGIGVVEADGVGDGVRSAAALDRWGWPGPRIAGTALITSSSTSTAWTSGRLTAGRPALVLEDAPYERLKDGFKQVEDEAEDQQEDQVDEEDARDHDPD